jgi:hypothetical protein
MRRWVLAVSLSSAVPHPTVQESSGITPYLSHSLMVFWWSPVLLNPKGSTDFLWCLKEKWPPKKGKKQYHVWRAVAEFIDPWLRDKVNSGIGLSYRPASHVAWSWLHPPVRDLWIRLLVVLTGWLKAARSIWKLFWGIKKKSKQFVKHERFFSHRQSLIIWYRSESQYYSEVVS